MTSVSRTFTFDESDVISWCRESGDSNKLHLNEQSVEDTPFDGRLVPGMMILDRVSGLLSEFGSAVGATPVLANIVACRFREPVYFGDEVEVTVSKDDEDNKFTYLDVEARVDGELSVHGTISVVLV